MIYINRKRIAIITALFVICITLLIIILNNTFSCGCKTKREIDFENANVVALAINYLLVETEKVDFLDLYDETGKNALNIKENNPESVKRLIEALQAQIIYKNRAYGPYLDNPRGTDASPSYSNYKPYWDKTADGKHVGYRIELLKKRIINKILSWREESNPVKEEIRKYDIKVNCYPVEEESESAIVYLLNN